ncbi:adenylosuccinate lyase [Rhodoluna sp. KAS3]|uniref:adenylosuccinate lyase n=1 Tax=Rhodoluna sp. KAS3 TaxID=942880 RepID=UPI00222ED3B0|nr:adenylosuccinate lyase [Rhodoluna sp. KAS3]BDS49715.1 adenylosuccinate lyase [Rhodoluna sp. KAS3]
MSNLSIQPLSPLDGRYRAAVSDLGFHLSEAGLNRARIAVEIEWLIHLANRDLLGTGTSISDSEIAQLRAIVTNFSDADVATLAETEATTKHDVKAVEYFIRGKLSELGRNDLLELTHFACTSEDINNLSYAITVRDAIKDVWLPRVEKLTAKLRELSAKYADAAMLSHTHGQPATPSTMGKEIAVFVHRLERQIKRIEATEYLGKFSGATGTFSAHVVAAPSVNWPKESEDFVSGLGLTWNPLTTQIESHDWQAELYTAVSLFNGILHNLCTDIWTYISMGYYKQIPVAGATGSSTMPHKINPIRFENAESNLELSNAILGSLASTLITSRLQRDLTDSSSQRNIGLGLGHSLLAIDNVTRGLNEIDLSLPVLDADLSDNWEILGEAIQTVIRAEVAAGRSTINDPYALLKDLTRGKRLSGEDMVAFVNGLEIGQEAKDRLLTLRPHTYVGVASELAKRIQK